MKRILVPTDGSECANAALEKAIELAKMYDSELTLLYVDEEPASKTFANPASADGAPGLTPRAPGTAGGDIGPGVPVRAPDSDQNEETSERAEKVLNNAKSRTISLQKPVTAISMRGNTAKVIMDFVEDSDIDLVVMGSSSKTGLKKHLLGSVADKVAKSIETSILIVR